MSFYYFLGIFEKNFDIRKIVGLAKILKKAENPSKTRRILTNFWLFSECLEPLVKCGTQKVVQKFLKHTKNACKVVRTSKNVIFCQNQTTKISYKKNRVHHIYTYMILK